MGDTKIIGQVDITTMASHTKIAICLLLVVTLAVAQEIGDGTKDKKIFNKKLPVRLGSDGRPLLFAPKIEMCQSRK